MFLNDAFWDNFLVFLEELWSFSNNVSGEMNLDESKEKDTDMPIKYERIDKVDKMIDICCPFHYGYIYECVRNCI